MQVVQIFWDTIMMKLSRISAAMSIALAGLTLTLSGCSEQQTSSEQAKNEQTAKTQPAHTAKTDKKED